MMSQEYDEIDYMYHDYDYNDTRLDIITEDKITKENDYIAHVKTALLIFNIIGGLTDILIIYLIKMTKKCRTRTLLIHMCFNDALLLLRIKMLLEYIMKPFKPIECLMEHLDGLLLTAYILFVIVTLLDTTVRMKKLPMKWIVAFIYLTVCCVGILRITLCSLYTENKYLGFIIVIVMLFLSIIIIVKDVTICCRKNGTLMEEDETIKVNVVRIVAYMIILTGVAVGSSHSLFGKEHGYLINKIMHMVLGIRPVFILLYLLIAHKELNMYVKNFFKLSKNRYDLEASVRLPDVENYDSGVTININGATTPSS